MALCWLPNDNDSIIQQFRDFYFGTLTTSQKTHRTQKDGGEHIVTVGWALSVGTTTTTTSIFKFNVIIM